MTEPDPYELRTRDEIAVLLGQHVTGNLILKATQRGEIAFYPVGKRHLYRLADVADWLEAKKRPVKIAGPIRAHATPLARARRSVSY